MPALTKILKVAPLTPIEAAQMAEAEKALGVSRGVYEQRQREYMAALEALKKKYDGEYQKNSAQQMSKYSAVIKDNCLVLMLD